MLDRIRRPCVCETARPVDRRHNRPASPANRGRALSVLSAFDVQVGFRDVTFALFSPVVDPPGIEPALFPEQRGQPAELVSSRSRHEPVVVSGAPGSRTPISWVQTKRLPVGPASRIHQEVRPGIEPDPRPYQGRVLPKHLQTVRFQ